MNTTNVPVSTSDAGSKLLTFWARNTERQGRDHWPISKPTVLAVLFVGLFLLISILAFGFYILKTQRFVSSLLKIKLTLSCRQLLKQIACLSSTQSKVLKLPEFRLTIETYNFCYWLFYSVSSSYLSELRRGYIRATEGESVVTSVGPSLHKTVISTNSEQNNNLKSVETMKSDTVWETTLLSIVIRQRILSRIRWKLIIRMIY